MSTVLPKRVLAGHDKTGIRASTLLSKTATLDPADVFARLGTGASGLTAGRAAALLAEHGANVLARDQRPGSLRLLVALGDQSAGDPAGRAGVGLVFDWDPRAGTVMVLIIVLSVGLRLYQEARQAAPPPSSRR